MDAISLPTGARLGYDMGQNAVVILFANECGRPIIFAQTNPRAPLLGQA